MLLWQGTKYVKENPCKTKAKLVAVLEIKYFLPLSKREPHQIRLYPILSCYISNYGSHESCWTRQSNNCFILSSTAFTMKATNKTAQSNFFRACAELAT